MDQNQFFDQKLVSMGGNIFWVFGGMGGVNVMLLCLFASVNFPVFN